MFPSLQQQPRTLEGCLPMLRELREDHDAYKGSLPGQPTTTCTKNLFIFFYPANCDISGNLVLFFCKEGVVSWSNCVTLFSLRLSALLCNYHAVVIGSVQERSSIE